MGAIDIILGKDYAESTTDRHRARVTGSGGELLDRQLTVKQVRELKKSGLWDKASLVMIPTSRKAGTLFNIKPTDGTGDFTFSKNSVKWVRGKDGYYREAPVNVPALEWSPTAQKFGVLVEPQATNLCQQSWKFAHSNWLKGNTVIEGDQNTAGTEMISNGSFSDGSSWLLGLGWIIADGKATFNGTGTSSSIQQNTAISIGDLCVLEYDISNYTSGTIQSDGVAQPVRRTANGHYIEYQIASSSYIGVRGIGSVIASVDNFSVKKVNGFDCPFIDVYNINLKRGFKLIESSASGTHYLQNYVTGITSGSQITIEVFAKYDGSRAQILISDENIGAASQGLFNIQTGTVVSGGATLKSITHIVDGWYLCTVTYTSPNTSVVARFYLRNGSSVSYVGDGVSGLLISQASVVQAAAGSSPIFTDGATVTRLADVASVTIPTAVTKITTTVNGVDVVDNSPTPGATYTAPNGLISKIIME